MTHAVKSASVLIGLSLLLGVALGSTGCILPDQLSRLEKDVASVQQQLRRVQLQSEHQAAARLSIERAAATHGRRPRGEA